MSNLDIESMQEGLFDKVASSHGSKFIKSEEFTAPFGANAPSYKEEDEVMTKPEQDIIIQKENTFKDTSVFEFDMEKQGEQVDNIENNEEDDEIDEEFTFENETDTDESDELDESEDGKTEELTREETLLKRIEELEKKYEYEESEKNFEKKYSKEKEVMPRITEYEFADLGRILAKKGALPEENIKSLMERGYEREAIDSYVKNALSAFKSEEKIIPEVNQNQVRDSYSKELNLSRVEFDSLVDSFVGSVTEEQINKFESLDSDKQIIYLQKFQVQKIKHDQKMSEEKRIKESDKKRKTMIRGNQTRTEKKAEYADISIDEALKNHKKAIRERSSSDIIKWASILNKKGHNDGFSF